MIGSHNLTFLPPPQHLEDLNGIHLVKSPLGILLDPETIEALSGFNALPEGAVDPSQKTLATFLSRPHFIGDAYD